MRCAYVAKGLAAQKAEREAMELQEKLNQMNENKFMEKARLSNEENAMKAKEEEHRRQIELGNYLREQINERHWKKQKLYEEFLKEKKYIDEIIRRIQEEQL